MRTRTRLLTILGSIALSLAAVACRSDGWPEYRSDDGRFTVVAPGDPESRTSAVPTPAGPLETHRVAFTPDDSVTYAVVYSDFPRQVLDRSTPDELLDGARAGLVAKVKGQLLREERIERQGHPGRAVEVAVPGGMTLTSDLLFVDGRLYQVMAVTSPAKTGSPEVRRFLDSFELTNRP